MLGCYNTWDLMPQEAFTSEGIIPTWRFSNLHVENKKYPRGRGMLSTWRRNKTSEEMIHAHVENKKYPRGDLRFSTWESDCPLAIG